MRRLILVLVPMLLLAGCEKYALNRQMEELCKKDGGVKIFETVILPPSRFGKYGELLPVMMTKEAKNLSELLFGDEYIVKTVTTTLKDGETHDRLYSEGKLDKNVEHVIRTFDGKILGENVWYSRIGGEFTPFGMPSGSNCPYPRDSLLNRVFLKE